MCVTRNGRGFLIAMYQSMETALGPQVLPEEVAGDLGGELALTVVKPCC